MDGTPNAGTNLFDHHVDLLAAPSRGQWLWFEGAATNFNARGRFQSQGARQLGAVSCRLCYSCVWLDEASFE
jgi:hypothetical protein